MQDRPKTPRDRLKNPWLYALPGGRLPDTVMCDNTRYTHVETFKHDFFAATGLYRGPTGLAVLKLGRATNIHSIPTSWIGKLLEGHEALLYEHAQGLPGVPRFIGRVGDNGLLHEYIPGHPLGRRDQVSDTFFDELEDLLRALHERHIAYVDLNKRQNILKGGDGKPYLIDFQISLLLPPEGWRRWWPVRWFLARFQHADWYHCLKHKRRLRPELLTPAEEAQVARLSIWIRLHRLYARPLTHLRRRILARLKRGEGASVTGSDAK